MRSGICRRTAFWAYNPGALEVKSKLTVADSRLVLVNETLQGLTGCLRVLDRMLIIAPVECSFYYVIHLFPTNHQQEELGPSSTVPGRGRWRQGSSECEMKR